MRSAEKMKTITRHVERSTQEQTRGSRQITRAIETISEMVSQLSKAHRVQAQGADTILDGLESVREGMQYQRSLIEQLAARVGLSPAPRRGGNNSGHRPAKHASRAHQG